VSLTSSGGLSTLWVDSKDGEARMRRTRKLFGGVVLGVAIMLAATVAGTAPSVAPAQWVQALAQAPAAVNQRPRETPPTAAPAERRDPAAETGGWVGWTLLVGIPALIIVWVFGRRRRWRRDRDRDRDPD